jgi:hypothetical protein
VILQQRDSVPFYSHLRAVILQDSVALKEAFPNHPIWSHQVFRHDAYAAFATQVKGHILEDATPRISMSVLEALPDLVDNLQSISNQVVQQSRAPEHETTQIKSKMDIIVRTHEGSGTDYRSKSSQIRHNRRILAAILHTHVRLPPHVLRSRRMAVRRPPVLTICE